MLPNYLSLEGCVEYLAISWPPKVPFSTHKPQPQILTRERRSSSGETHHRLTHQPENSRENQSEYFDRILAQQNGMQIISHNFHFSSHYCNLLNLDKSRIERIWRETRKSFGSAEYAFLYLLQESNVAKFPEEGRSVEQLNNTCYTDMEQNLRMWGYKEVLEDNIRVGDLVLYLNRSLQVVHYAVMESKDRAISKFSVRQGIFKHKVSSADEFHQAKTHRFFRKNIFQHVIDKLNWEGMTALIEGKMCSNENLNSKEQPPISCEETFNELKDKCLKLLKINLNNKELMISIHNTFEQIQLPRIDDLEYIRAQIPRIYNPHTPFGLKVSAIKFLELKIRDLFFYLIPNF